MKIQSKKNTSLKDSLIRRYHSALEEFPLYALLIAAFYIYYRLRIWMMIGDTYASLGGLGYGSYLGIYGYSDAAILLLSLAIILAFIMATESGSLLRHIPVSVFIFIQAAGLLFGIEFFRVYETTLQKSFWADEAATGLSELIISFLAEASWLFFAGMIIAIIILAFTTWTLMKKNGAAPREPSGIRSFFPGALCLFLILLMLFTGGEARLRETAAMMPDMDPRQAYTTLHELAMNPNYNMLFESRAAGKPGIAPVMPAIDSNGPMNFRLDTRSMESKSLHPRINILPRGRKYNIIFYFFESTPARMIDHRINGKWVTPVWRALMKNSIVARNHYANYPLSANALLSIFTSSYDHPGKELVIQNYPSVPLMTAPEILKDRGYRNCLIHTGSLLYAGQKKFLQGRKFDSILHYHDLKNTPPYNYQVGWGLDERSMIKPAIDFMKQNTGSPCFLTLMPVNPHHPYAIPSRTEEERRRFMITGPIPEELPHREKIRMDYFNSLHYADAALGELVEALEKEGLMDNTLLFVMADHGEAFYEHRGNYNHPFFLYEENVHVPMIIYNKKLIPSTVEIEAITRHIDILPTVLDLLDIPGRREQEGLSILSGRPEQMALLHTNWKDDFLGVRDGRWKYIRRMSDSREELYDLAGDPAERKNLSEERADITQRYRAYTDSARAYNVRFYREILRGVEVGGKGPSAFRTDEKTWEDYKEDAKNKKPDAIR